MSAAPSSDMIGRYTYRLILPVELDALSRMIEGSFLSNDLISRFISYLYGKLIRTRIFIANIAGFLIQAVAFIPVLL